MARNSTRSQIVILVSAFMIHFVTHGIVYSFGVMFVVLDSLFDGTKAEIAWIGSIFTSMLFINGPLTGYLTSRFGCRAVAVGGSLTGFLGYGISLFVSNLYVLYITMGLIAGNGFGFLYLPAMVAVTEAFNKYRTVACGLSLCGAGIGAFIFSPLQKFLLDTYAWQGTLLINAGIILNCIPFALMLKQDNAPSALKPENDGKLMEDNCRDGSKDAEASEAILNTTETFDGDGYAEANTSTNFDCFSRQKEIYSKVDASGYAHTPDSSTDIAANDLYLRQPLVKFIPAEKDKDCEGIIETQCHSKTSREASFMNNFIILREPLFVLFATSQFLFFFGLYLPFMYIPDRAKTIGIDESSAVWAVSTIGIASIVSRVVLGYIVDRLSIDRVKFVAGTLLVGGISTALGPVLVSLWMLFVYAAVYGITIGVSISFITAVLVDLLGMEKLNEAFGMNNMFTGIAVLLGPPFTGLLYDISGNYDATFIAAGASQTLAGVLMMLTPLLKKKQQPRLVKINNPS